MTSQKNGAIGLNNVQLTKIMPLGIFKIHESNN